MVPLRRLAAAACTNDGDFRLNPTVVIEGSLTRRNLRLASHHGRETHLARNFGRDSAADTSDAFVQSRSHSYQGYALRIQGILGTDVREFLVGIGEAAQAKQRFQAGDVLTGAKR